MQELDTIEQQKDGKWVASRGTIHVLGDTEDHAKEGLRKFLEKGLNGRFCMGCGSPHEYCTCSSTD